MSSSSSACRRSTTSAVIPSSRPIRPVRGPVACSAGFRLGQTPVLPPWRRPVPPAPCRGRPGRARVRRGRDTPERPGPERFAALRDRAAIHRSQCGGGRNVRRSVRPKFPCPCPGRDHQYSHTQLLTSSSPAAVHQNGATSCLCLHICMPPGGAEVALALRDLDDYLERHDFRSFGRSDDSLRGLDVVTRGGSVGAALRGGGSCRWGPWAARARTRSGAGIYTPPNVAGRTLAVPPASRPPRA